MFNCVAVSVVVGHVQTYKMVTVTMPSLTIATDLGLVSGVRAVCN